jgi:hypothetical protein
MAAAEMFKSESRSLGDFAGVFEYDGEVGYFYLYADSQAAGQKVLDAIQILRGTTDLEANDLQIRWSSDETAVGLFIRGRLWAAFNVVDGCKAGGMYGGESARPNLPPTVKELFL